MSSTCRPSSSRRRSGAATDTYRFTTRAAGDFGREAPPAELDRRRQAVIDLPWTWLDQVHGDDVVLVSEPGGSCGSSADAAVTDVPGAVLSITTADCAPILLWSHGPNGCVVGAAHAGWRGLYAGVIERTVEAMRGLGASRPSAAIGPCISASRYEFGEADLTTMALRFGPEVVAATAADRPALDLVAAVKVALASSGAELAAETAPPCTASALDAEGAPRYYSWRARGDRGRQASVIWIPLP